MSKIRQVDDKELVHTLCKRIVGPCKSKAEWPEYAIKLAELHSKLTHELADNRPKFIRDYVPWMYGIQPMGREL